MNSESVDVPCLTSVLSDLHVDQCEASTSIEDEKGFNDEPNSAKVQSGEMVIDAELQESFSTPVVLESLDTCLQNSAQNEHELNLEQAVKSPTIHEAMHNLTEALKQATEALNTFTEAFKEAIQECSALRRF